MLAGSTSAGKPPPRALAAAAVSWPFRPDRALSCNRLVDGVSNDFTSIIRPAGHAPAAGERGMASHSAPGAFARRTAPFAGCPCCFGPAGAAAEEVNQSNTLPDASQNPVYGGFRVSRELP